MIYNQTSAQERINMRHTLARLKPLNLTLSEARIKMQEIALQIKDKGLKGSILNFVSETGACEEQVKSSIATLLQALPVHDAAIPAKKEQDIYQTNCPFDCAKNYEKKIIKYFRNTINDYKVIKEIRELMPALLNEILYAFLKIRMLSSFSVKELRAQSNLF